MKIYITKRRKCYYETKSDAFKNCYLQLINLVVPDRDSSIGICTVGGRDASAVCFKDKWVTLELVPFTQVLFGRLEYNNCAHSLVLAEYSPL
jgi:hypothetical protein